MIMAKEAFDMHTCSLEMKGGLAPNIDYPAKYHHAPKSLLPKRYNHAEDMAIHGNPEAMKITMGK
jgi:hypothetical protein